jgi:hypothetical protein
VNLKLLAPFYKVKKKIRKTLTAIQTLSLVPSMNLTALELDCTSTNK